MHIIVVTLSAQMTSAKCNTLHLLLHRYDIFTICHNVNVYTTLSTFNYDYILIGICFNSSRITSSILIINVL